MVGHMTHVAIHIFTDPGDADQECTVITARAEITPEVSPYIQATSNTRCTDWQKEMVIDTMTAIYGDGVEVIFHPVIV